MSDNSSEQEPSIEEILASIRQIISDDDDDINQDDKTPEEPEEVLESPVRDGHDDVLELTEADLAEQEEPAPKPRPKPEPEPETEKPIREPEPAFAPPPPPIQESQPPRQSVPSDIMSSGTQAAAMSSISKLTNNMPINNSRSYNGVTLEDIVREMLNPMLREWMDDNLPPMVERIVQKELEKLARRAFDE